MGEEEAKKPQEAAKKMEEENKEEAPKAEKPVADEKKEDKKPEGPKTAEQAPPPSPPPQEIVLKVFMHCEGCARKVRRCLKGFDGVEEVITDCRSSKVIVKGEKADPLKVLERVQKKSHRPVELISPIPKPEEAKKLPEVKEVVKVEEKKEELPVITVVLGVYMHCEACAQEIRKRIQKMKGVESVEPDLKGSQVVVKGAFEPEKLADYIHKRTGKHAVIIKTVPEKKGEEKKEGKEEKKTGEVEKKEAKKTEGPAKEKIPAPAAGGVEPPAPAPVVLEAEDNESRLEMRRNEFYNYQYPLNYQVYPQMPVYELQAYPPQMFSDENPNACSVM